MNAASIFFVHCNDKTCDFGFVGRAADRTNDIEMNLNAELCSSAAACMTSTGYTSRDAISGHEAALMCSDLELQALHRSRPSHACAGRFIRRSLNVVHVPGADESTVRAVFV